MNLGGRGCSELRWGHLHASLGDGVQNETLSQKNKQTKNCINKWFIVCQILNNSPKEKVNVVFKTEKKKNMVDDNPEIFVRSMRES